MKCLTDKVKSPIKFQIQYDMKDYKDFDLAIYYSFTESKPNKLNTEKRN